MKWSEVPRGGIGQFAGRRFRRVNGAEVMHDGSFHVEVEYLQDVPPDICAGARGLIRADDEAEAR